MCTALYMDMGAHFFGRTLDHIRSYREEITFVPRNYPLPLRHVEDMPTHYAFIGMAFVPGGFPLMYDGANEHGLCMAGLNFSQHAVFPQAGTGKNDVAQFEFLPFILGSCKTVAEARAALDALAIVDTPYSPDLPTAPLHWIIADAHGSIVVESMADGLHVHEDPLGVLANDPPFDIHLSNVANMTSIPGDLSSQARFMRLSKMKETSAIPDTTPEKVSQFFHVIATVEQPKGCGKDLAGNPMHTIYTSCIDAANGIYHVKTYDRPEIRSAAMTDNDGTELSRILI